MAQPSVQALQAECQPLTAFQGALPKDPALCPQKPSITRCQRACVWRPTHARRAQPTFTRLPSPHHHQGPQPTNHNHNPPTTTTTTTTTHEPPHQPPNTKHQTQPQPQSCVGQVQTAAGLTMGSTSSFLAARARLRCSCCSRILSMRDLRPAPSCSSSSPAPTSGPTDGTGMYARARPCNNDNNRVRACQKCHKNVAMMLRLSKQGQVCQEGKYHLRRQGRVRSHG